MAANEKLHPIQFNYERYGSDHNVIARDPAGGFVGNMRWSAKQVRNVMVREDYQRQGIATAMWNEGHRLATENQRVPKPRHSPDRTDAGDAWAKRVGGPLPRRVQNED
jgi:GNAT superfamily N-acetyltransferase